MGETFGLMIEVDILVLIIGGFALALEAGLSGFILGAGWADGMIGKRWRKMTKRGLRPELSLPRDVLNDSAAPDRTEQRQIQMALLAIEDAYHAIQAAHPDDTVTIEYMAGWLDTIQANLEKPLHG